MKAVAFGFCDGEPLVPFKELDEGYLLRVLWNSVTPFEMRYDNGQLCTFRRKTKGQNNER